MSEENMETLSMASKSPGEGNGNGLDPAKLTPRHREELQALRSRVRRFLDEEIDHPDVKVKVTLDEEGWFEFQGRVDQSGTKAALFGMVPSKQGAQHIVDRLRVGRLTSSDQ
jgi:hypothetical protein